MIRDLQLEEACSRAETPRRGEGKTEYLHASPSRRNKPTSGLRRGLAVSAKAFSIIELLVATSLLALLLGLLFQIFGETTRAWAASERAADAYREARAALFLISQDLRSAFLSTSTPLAINEPSLVAHLPPEQQNQPSLFFITAQPIEGQNPGDLSDLCAVGYYVAFTNASGAFGASSFNLHRYFRTSNRTFLDEPPSGSGPTGLKPFIAAGANPAQLATLLFPLRTPTGGSMDEILARNAFNFTVKFQDPAALSWRDDPALFPTPTLAAPGMIELSLDALNNDTASKLDGDLTAWQAQTGPTYENIIRPNRQAFTLRVDLPKPVPTP